MECPKIKSYNAPPCGEQVYDKATYTINNKKEPWKVYRNGKLFGEVTEATVNPNGNFTAHVLLKTKNKYMQGTTVFISGDTIKSIKRPL